MILIFKETDYIYWLNLQLEFETEELLYVSSQKTRETFS